MFDKILIANRGEIACRIMHTAARMGVKTVAVYSDADANALHVKTADQAVHIGPSPVASSYLRGDVIIQAALDTGAHAIHPGYGFLSENPDFADAVYAAGLVFIGPSGDAIRAMGLKDAAKALMEQAKVPVVPGYHGSNQDDAFLGAQAEAIGYPVLIKAVAGGGGKGMRLVQTANEFEAALNSARSEAKAAFGNTDVLVEKFVQSPRHIEIQVFGDSHGNVVHLFERDCSLQRRHQKVIEEAPAPGMTDAVRAAMGAAAVRAASSINYCGAGTVEFIVDGSSAPRADGFWFMEMNTRLQVEHPVTEAITGQDLVEWQLRVAAGECLPKRQEDLSINGWAFEARIYAEDVNKGFLPATGKLTHLAFPSGARADTGVVSGDAISPYYDPMIAKLTVHGSNRANSLRSLVRALKETEVVGTVTNLSFLAALAQNDIFAAGDMDTGLIARELEALTAEVPLSDVTLAIGCIALGGFDTAPHQGFTLWSGLSRSVHALVNGDLMSCVVIQKRGGMFDVELGDRLVSIEQRDGWYHAGQKQDLRIVSHALGVSVFDAYATHFAHVDLLDRRSDEAGGDGLIRAPMPGAVKSIDVSVGDVLQKGAPICVLEAMKMEHQLNAPFYAKVEDISAVQGAQVKDGSVLVRLSAMEES